MSPSVIPLALARELAPAESARPVPGASRYWVTDHGRVFSTVNNVIVMRQTRHSKGYLKVDLWRGPDRDPDRPARWRPYVHELVALAFIGPRPSAPGVAYEIDHRDGDKANNRLDNLDYVTKSMNVQLAIASGLHSTATLTAAAVWALRCHAFAVGDHDAVRRAVEEHGMTARAVRNAIAGRSWPTVPDPASRPSVGVLVAALFLDSDEDARRLLRLSPFSPDYVGAGDPAFARILPFQSSGTPMAA